MSNYRALFNIPESVHFLNSAFISPQMKSITAAGASAVTLKEQPWGLQASDFFTSCDQLRVLVAKLMKVSPDNIALIPAVSYGVETAALNLAVGPGQKVLMPEGEFPSNVYPWKKGSIEFVSRPSNYDWTQAFIEAIDDKTAVVSVPQTDWSDGSHFDLQRISRRAKEVGAALVVDVSQSFGVVPIDVAAIDPDYLFTVGYKWQLGPYGMSYMYVADRHLEGRPIENNWVNRKSSEDFTRLTEYTDEYHVGARRFDSGQHSNLVLLPMAIEAMKFLMETTPEQIFDYIQNLNKSLIRGLRSLGFETVPVEYQTGHMVGAKAKSGHCVKDLCGRLREKEIYLSVRCNSLRISPHIYNTESDISFFLGELEPLVQKLKTRSMRELGLEA